MESTSSHLSLVSRAKTALHSAAAKAEKVLTDIKSDLKSDRDSDGQSQKGSKKPTVLKDESEGKSQEVLTRTQDEILERGSNEEDDCLNTSENLIIPPASVIKQLASAVESGKNFKSMNELLTFVGDPSPVKEKTGLNFSVMKSLVLREKEEKMSSKFCWDEEARSLICFLFKSEEQFSQRKNPSALENLYRTTSLKDLHGALPESFVVQLSQIIGGFKSLQKMATFWCSVIIELRKLWSEGQPIPRMPIDADPDLNCCLLYQQLQVINCCIARKQRRTVAKESLDSVLEEANLNSIDAFDSQDEISPNPNIYARTNSGKFVLRLGAVHPSENLFMLETGEPIYSPVTQEGPILTEEQIKETEEFVLRTGSVGAGCSQLLSDMQAFKAANPGCILEDFVRWHSPPDWKEMQESHNEANESVDGEGSSRRGRLSQRMQKEGNLWRELWETAKALPAVKQTPLFDEDLAVESILNTLEDIPPSELFQQLFVSALCAGLLIAQAAVPVDCNLSKLFYECKDYVIATYQSSISNEKLDDICKVYETVEAIIVHPEEAIIITEQSDETTSVEPKSRFKKISLNFIGRDKQPLRKDEKKSEEKHMQKDEKKSEEKRVQKDEKKSEQKHMRKDEKKSEEKHMHLLSQLFDKRGSIFSKDHAKSKSSQPTVLNAVEDGEWTIV